MALLRDGGADSSSPSLWYRVTRSGWSTGGRGDGRSCSSPSVLAGCYLPHHTPDTHTPSLRLTPGRPTRIAKTGAFVGLMTRGLGGNSRADLPGLGPSRRFRTAIRPQNFDQGRFAPAGDSPARSWPFRLRKCSSFQKWESTRSSPSQISSRAAASRPGPRPGRAPH